LAQDTNSHHEAARRPRSDPGPPDDVDRLVDGFLDASGWQPLGTCSSPTRRAGYALDQWWAPVEPPGAPPAPLQIEVQPSGLSDHSMVLARTGLPVPEAARAVEPDVVEWDRNGDWESALSRASQAWHWLASALHALAQRAGELGTWSTECLAWTTWIIEAVAVLLGHSCALVVTRGGSARGQPGWAKNRWLQDRAHRTADLSR
jgi:hypothetical protein